ncbi:WecB/TagA/CpsF family glycosyltransferase [Oryzibacter oryziterrae]|uniref:WecB/TagA/CpsF family glycosyltransferase n=1 Tax=Oryzibacter oryziterrae TaxID=2766474 RepID=UPI001F406CCA|nr:WecB/TagA/CpsF family glycosyltransferase [Oryzibacter oryziterrae]
MRRIATPFDTTDDPPVADGASIPRFRILGVPVNAIDLPTAVKQLTSLARLPQPSRIFVREAASLMLAIDEPEYASLHETATLIVPDGMPLVWIGRLRGFKSTIGRVAGADLLEAVCAASVKTGQSHFFYGGGPGIVEELVQNLNAQHPGLKIAGALTPPMIPSGPLTDIEALIGTDIETIRQADPDFIWIGISSPKQEFLMEALGPLIGRGVFSGIGAAFNFHAGTIKRAPGWMRDYGFEWLYRLLKEPRRLWRRYIVLVPRFTIAVIAEQWAIFRGKK